MPNKKILITIIVPFYNCKNLVTKHFKKIKSLNNNSLLEVIYIDDGSDDKANFFLKKNTKNINNFHILKLNKNCGPGIARNKGIKKACGSFILFLDIDDYLISSGLKKLISLIKKNKNYDLIFFNYIKKINKIKINLSKKILKKNILIKSFLRTDLDMCPNFYLFNRKFLLRKKIFFKKGYYEDILFILKVFVNIKNKKHISDKVYEKNQNKKSITNTFSEKHIIDFMHTSFSKYNFFFKKIFNKFNNVSFSDLQYGLRGDYIFARKLLSRCQKADINEEMIDNSYKKIINQNFHALTTYDKTVKRILFLKQ